ncbi:hypothetical protein RRG08_006930 [Elysia crispata]|uniref:Uncharacterized protein n=1 Tax=Elysia crispata TaxID=231223 RepID=A0AAE0YJ54_9GAST|nr:hypothetical protein RRG08_006930 [Elysia crispata]
MCISASLCSIVAVLFVHFGILSSHVFAVARELSLSSRVYPDYPSGAPRLSERCTHTIQALHPHYLSAAPEVLSNLRQLDFTVHTATSNQGVHTLYLSENPNTRESCPCFVRPRIE